MRFATTRRATVRYGSTPKHTSLKMSNTGKSADWSKLCTVIPDIDETGIRKGVELAMKHLEIRTMWLPDMKNFGPLRGKPRKALRDFTELYPDIRSFKQLLETAMPMHF